MFLATAMALPAGIDRIGWLPTTVPASPLAIDLYTLLAVSPMLVWDVIRNRICIALIGSGSPVTVPIAVVVEPAVGHAVLACDRAAYSRRVTA